MQRILVLAGINNSGPAHWQTLWQEKYPGFAKVEHRDWDNPVCAEWVDDIEHAVRQSGPETILLAHSLACLALAHWAARTSLRVKAAMLVAVPDPRASTFPKEASGFENFPLEKFAFPSIVVTSTNDPFGSVEHTQACAAAWGSHFIVAGAYGHINAASGLGEWPEGYEILCSLAG